jgi:hypothetical protein
LCGERHRYTQTKERRRSRRRRTNQAAKTLSLKREERYGRVSSSLFASFDVLMMVLFRGCNFRGLGGRKVVNWFVVFSEAWF